MNFELWNILLEYANDIYVGSSSTVYKEMIQDSLNLLRVACYGEAN